MHRDVKLGLALGILVIGFAAAFCFPRQPATELAVNPAAGLKLAAIDEEIRLERRRTFVEDELNPPEQPTLADAVQAPAGPETELPPLQTAAMRAQALQRSAPEPIRRDVPIPVDESIVAVEPGTTGTVTPAAEAPAEETLYTVQSGDTLSAVASKTLGSSRKYEAIFEANRDVMATPNSLRIGMKLRIPQEAESVAKRAPTPFNPVAQRSLDYSISAGRIAGRDESTLKADQSIPRGSLFSPVGPTQRHAVSGDVVPR